MALTEPTVSTPGRVWGTFQYLVPSAERPVTFADAPGMPSRAPERATYEAHTVPVADARPIAATLGLDTHGFALIRQRSRVADFYDDDAIRDIYLPELEDLVHRATGARRVVVFDTTRRAESPDLQARHRIRGPAQHVHNDYTERSAQRRVRDLLPADEAEALLRRRFAIVNVWRPVRGPVESRPLGICDARTIAPADLIATERRSATRVGEIQHVTFNPDHRWFHFPEQLPDEVSLIKCFDSAEDGRARFTAHAAFDSSATPEGAAPRESIEARTFAFF